jgi:type I restriction enzyme S subunit
MVNQAHKNIEIRVIPQDWEIYKLEELTPPNIKYTIVDGPFGSNLKTVHYKKKGIPIITSGCVTDGKFFAENYLYVDKEKFQQEKRSSVQPGDIIMAKIGERCGASAILPLDHPESILSGNALKIKIDSKRFSTELVSQILFNDYLRGKLHELRTVGAQPAISMASLKTYQIPLPPLPEQKAIAEALSDTDAWVESLEQLIAKKRLIKQGAMQELLRAKEGWEVRKLGEVISVRKGQLIQGSDTRFYGDIGQME